MERSTLRNVTAVIAKVIEVFSLVLTAISTVILGLFTFGTKMIMDVFETVKGLEPQMFEQAMRNGAVYLTDSNGNMNFAGMRAGALVIIITCALTAVICRNLYMIFKKSDNESPFSDDIIKRIKTIGICAIASPAVQIIIAAIVRMIFGMELSLDGILSKLFLGLVVLCLSQYFVYGAQIEKDVDGLL